MQIFKKIKYYLNLFFVDFNEEPNEELRKYLDFYL